MKFTKEFLRDKIGNAIYDNITGNTRWSIHHHMVFEHDDKYYSVNYSCGATEMQDELPFEYADEEIECKEVELKEVKIKEWVGVEKMNINTFLDMTKDEFLIHVNKQELCPNDFELECIGVECEDGTNEEECTKCWKKAIENLEFFNPLITFEKNSIEIIDDLHLIEQQYKQLSEGRDKLKDRLLLLMEHYGVDKFDNDKLSITYVKGSNGTSFDSAKFKKENKGLFEAYQKPSVRAASIRFKVK